MMTAEIVEFIRHVEIGKNDMGHTAKIMLTPDLARYLLDRNPENRRLAQSTVNRYADDIANKRFIFNGETIIISVEGMLNTGQHRCQAVIQCGVPVLMLFAFGLPRETRFTTDDGKPKRNGDVAEMMSMLYSHIGPTISAWDLQHHNLGFLSTQTRYRPSRAVTMENLKAKGDKILEAIRAHPVKDCRLIGGLCFVAYCHLQICDGSPVVGAEFMEKFRIGNGIEVGDPILYARNRIMTTKLEVNLRAELVFRAWNIWAETYPEKTVVRSIPLSKQFTTRLPKLRKVTAKTEQVKDAVPLLKRPRQRRQRRDDGNAQDQLSFPR